MADKLGEQLRQARETRHLTFDQVSEATRIRPYYIQALEKDDYSAIPSSAQARGFLRIYASYLNLNLDELLSAARMEEQAQTPTPPATPMPAAPSPQAVPPPAPEKQPRPGFLTGLLDRFARRPSAPSPESTVAPEAPAVSGPAPVQTAEKPVPPVVVKQPLPAAYVPPQAEPQLSISPAGGREKTQTKKTAGIKRPASSQASKSKTTPIPKGKKPAARLKKSSEDSGSIQPQDEKKKITE